MANYKLQHQYFNPSINKSEHFNHIFIFKSYEKVVNYCLDTSESYEELDSVFDKTDFSDKSFYFSTLKEKITFRKILPEDKKHYFVHYSSDNPIYSNLQGYGTNSPEIRQGLSVGDVMVQLLNNLPENVKFESIIEVTL